MAAPPKKSPYIEPSTRRPVREELSASWPCGDLLLVLQNERPQPCSARPPHLRINRGTRHAPCRRSRVVREPLAPSCVTGSVGQPRKSSCRGRVVRREAAQAGDEARLVSIATPPSRRLRSARRSGRGRLSPRRPATPTPYGRHQVEGVYRRAAFGRSHAPWGRARRTPGDEHEPASYHPARTLNGSRARPYEARGEHHRCPGPCRGAVDSYFQNDSWRRGALPTMSLSSALPEAALPRRRDPPATGTRPPATQRADGRRRRSASRAGRRDRVEGGMSDRGGRAGARRRGPGDVPCAAPDTTHSRPAQRQADRNANSSQVDATLPRRS